MGNLYHDLRAGCAFLQPARANAVFLRHAGARAYSRRMVPRARVLAAIAIMGALGSAATTHASAYGRIDAFVVRETIRKDLPKIHRCYESALRYEPELAGKVKVRFAVERKGHVGGVKVLENTTGNQSVERCVARVVGAIRFPSRRTGKRLSFTFPFVFAPQN